MVGESEVFSAVQALIGKMAAFDAPVLIEGETGTGKELAARAIHYGGARSHGPFVPVNCGALPDLLIENELFGHRRGAFTGARDDHPGLVAIARGGTLFLDEIGTLTPKGQITLLRFLQDQQFRPLGGRQEQQADVRIIAASNCGLEGEAERGAFRLDLLHRFEAAATCGCRRCASAAATSRCWRGISCAAAARLQEARRSRSTPRPWNGSGATTGRATSRAGAPRASASFSCATRPPSRSRRRPRFARRGRAPGRR